MKKTLIALAVVAAVTASIPAVMAQPGYGPGMRGGPNLQYMSVILDLTAEQQAKVKALFAEQAERRAQMRSAMQAEMQSKMQGILTKEQFAKMQELRQARMSSFRGGMGPGGRGPGYGPGNCPGAGLGPRSAR